METKVNLFLLSVLVVAWAGVTLAEPAAALDPVESSTGELADLEDAFAADRTDPTLARALAEHYLRIQQPQLAVAAISSASAEVREDPAVLHRLAKGYEHTGRIDDALATAELARARCARALGTSDSSAVTPVPERRCSERTYVSLDMHASALSHMARWGVVDVRHDDRARRAYALAVRHARLLSASAE